MVAPTTELEAVADPFTVIRWDHLVAQALARRLGMIIRFFYWLWRLASQQCWQHIDWYWGNYYIFYFIIYFFCFLWLWYEICILLAEEKTSHREAVFSTLGTVVCLGMVRWSIAMLWCCCCCCCCCWQIKYGDDKNLVHDVSLVDVALVHTG